jgi:hypothetical protein
MRAAWRPVAERVVSDLQRVFAARLRAVVAYGPRVEDVDHEPLATLALVTDLSQQDLEVCARATGQWRKAGAAIPLLIATEEFRRSLDAFPLEFGEIIRAHERVFGDDPFAGLTVSPEDRRRACEHQARSHLVHLREGFLEAGGRPDAVAEVVTESAPAFAALLRTVAALADGTSSPNRLDATLEGARAAGVSEGVVRDLLALERRSGLGDADAARLFPEYLVAVERLVRTVDAWPS